MVTPNIGKAFEIAEHGVLYSVNGDNKVWSCAGTIDPSSVGLAAPITSVFYKYDTGDTYRKTGTGNTDWELEGLGNPIVTQGFNFGANGNTPANTYINRIGGISSNIVGLPTLISSGEIKTISVENQNVNTYGIEVYEHDGNLVNSTLLYTLNVVSDTGAQASNLTISITKGKQIAAKTITGAAQNIGVTIIAKGTSL